MARTPANSGAPSSTKCEPAATPAQQMEQVRKWVVSGATAADIEEAIAKAYPTADARALMLCVFDAITETGSAPAGTLRGFCIEALKELYRRMVEIGDYPGALRAVKELQALDETGPTKAARPKLFSRKRA